MDFLTILQTAADELGLPRPSSVSSTDLQTRQLTALINRDGNALRQDHGWTPLQLEYVIEFGQPIARTGTLTNGSKVVTGLSTTADLVANAFAITGSGIQIACRLQTIDSGSQITMTESATESGSVELTFLRDTFDLPDDFDRFIDQTQWDRRFQWSLIGPTSPQFDEWQRSGIVTVGPRRRWRQVGVKPLAFRLFPPPTADDTPGTLAFEYISINWVQKADGSFTNKLEMDDDVPLFDESVMVLGAKWRMWQIKGFDYGALQAEYMDYLDSRKSHDGGMPILKLNKRQPGFLVSPGHIQDADFPGPGN